MNILVNFKIIKEMVKELLNGPMEENILELGLVSKSIKIL